MSKYRCRGCPVQEQCIDQSNLASGAKEMIRNAFAARTDTLSTWGTLQKNCLLVKEDEEAERRAREGSLLGRRLREAQTVSTAEEDQVPAEEAVQPGGGAQVKVIIGPASSGAAKAAPAAPNLSTPLPPAAGARDGTPTAKKSRANTDPFRTNHLETTPLGPAVPARPARPNWLVIGGSERRITLPQQGELILGRFDPHRRDPLDIDLTFEDKDKITVSRRHAKVAGAEGRHTIEDLGSSNGSSVNGVLLTPGAPHPLQPGDCIALGGILIDYEPMPADLFAALTVKTDQVRHWLYLTHVGRRVEITSPNTVTIGRADREANFTPSLDLSRDSEMATFVSRRHAVITWNGSSPYFKDLQSTFGSRLNGEALPPNEPFPLRPGDHISLGGCVLAYDVEL